MGFDISYHPISLEEMKEWYFDRLSEAGKEDFSKIRDIGHQMEMDEFYINQYIETMKVAAATQQQENFEKTHAYYLAVVQGFFNTYYYTRGTAFSFLLEEKPQLQSYVTSWNNIKPSFIGCPVGGALTENYSGGVYLGPDQVLRLLDSCRSDEAVHQILEDYFEQNLPVFMRALEAAAGHHRGLLEAAEVVEPQPLDLSKTTSYSDLSKCDKEGAFLYQQRAMEQLKAFAAQENIPAGEIIKKAEYRKITSEPGEAELGKTEPGKAQPEKEEPGKAESEKTAARQSIWGRLFKKNK